MEGLVTSRRAIHEATYFDSDLEANPHPLWFYGKLVCSFIDDLWNNFDERFEAGLEPDAANPMPILDPSRQTGLARDHPFVQALFRETIKRLRPLVEEERQREEKQRADIESEATRSRLNALEKAAVKFMKEFGEDEEALRDPDRSQAGSRFRTQGYVLNPPFVQMIEGHTQKLVDRKPGDVSRTRGRSQCADRMPDSRCDGDLGLLFRRGRRGACGTSLPR